MKSLLKFKNCRIVLPIITFLLCFVLPSFSLGAQRLLTYGPAPTYTGYFGQWVLHEQGWDRYLMYFSISSSVVNGKPANTTPGDNGTYNSKCNTWWGDRIWLTWHFGEGKDPAGWNANDGYGNIPPFMVLNIGGAGESALIGDPSVVYWKNKWHMFYEGTDSCDGSNNRIFHATADSWFGPWTKQGEVQGLWGMVTGSGLSWPTILVEDDQLYLYFTDGYVRLLAAKALDSTGHNFVMMNYDVSKPLGLSNPAPVSAELINRGQVVKNGSLYKLLYDNFGRTAISMSESNDKFNFPSGTIYLLPQSNSPNWENLRVGLPSYLAVGGEQRIYYTGEGSDTKGLGVYSFP
ncbi:MAG: hypothetical protein FD174_2517 [Geobacteraceae bacterium]|nr:MAG: hypothetical protein FD174_2517 [Geobacteraceae bacterium]